MIMQVFWLDIQFHEKPPIFPHLRTTLQLRMKQGLKTSNSSQRQGDFMINFNIWYSVVSVLVSVISATRFIEPHDINIWYYFFLLSFFSGWRIVWFLSVIMYRMLFCHSSHIGLAYHSTFSCLTIIKWFVKMLKFKEIIRGSFFKLMKM